MRTVTLGLGHPCCTGALCAHGDRGADVAAVLRRGGDRLVLRGAPRGAALRRLVARARNAGFTEVVLATAAIDRLDDPGGADVVCATLLSHVPAVHDRLTGRDGSLVEALVRLRRLRVPIEIEAPLLPARLSDPREVVALARRAVDVRRVRFYVPTHAVPRAVAPPRFDVIGPLVDEAIAEVEARFDPSQGVPPCALARHERFDFPPEPRPVAGRAFADACEDCAVRRACGGPTVAYREAHGDAGLRPLAEWPEALRGEPPRDAPVFGEVEAAAAEHAQMVVLRPTLHCNQDCLFCSANESSRNAFEEPEAMRAAIARAAERGVRRVSFSGGEPTLQPRLAELVAEASARGVPEVEVVTNAVLLAKPGRARALADAGLTHAFVSLHAHDEALSRAMTQKVGDHARTLAGIEALREAGVLVAVNHVITSRNHAYLTAFVEMLAARFDPRVFLSFAFVTPQYKALARPALIPRLSDTMPHLRRAMRRAIEVGQPFVIGSRQGVPPCFLGPFAAWSDVFGVTAEAASEDAPQKAQGPACARCRYREICTGLWRPYADRYGFDELVAIEGEAFGDDELAAIRGWHREPPWGVPRSFDEAPPPLRDRDAERAPDPEPAPAVALPVIDDARTRPLRVLMLGTGRRARRLAERAAEAGGIALVGVASPHAPDAAGWWGAVPAFRDARAAIDAVAPEAVIVAAATHAHAELVEACADRPVLLEKPAAARSSGWVTMALQERFEPGLAPLLEEQGTLRVAQRCRPTDPDAPRAWGHAPLFELLHHLVTLPVLARGALRSVDRVRFGGRSRPEALHAWVTLERGAAELAFDATASEAALRVEVGGRSWARIGRRIERDGAPIERTQGAEVAMLSAFRDAVLHEAPPPVSLSVGADVEVASDALLQAFEEAGAPLVRATEPKHAATWRKQRGRTGR